MDTSNRRSEGEKWCWRWKGEEEGGGLGLDQLEQTSQWGVGDFYAADSHAASSFTSTNCGEGRAEWEEAGTAAKQRGG